MKKQINYPLDYVEKFSTFKEMLALAEKQDGDKIAFKYNEGGIREVTYRQFCKTVRSLGTALAVRGVGDCHIACVGENSYKWLVAFLTVLCSKGVFVPIDKELPGKDILNVIARSDSEVVFYSAKYEKLIRENLEELKHIKYFIGIDAHEHDGKFLSMDRLIEEGAALLEGGDTSYTSMEFDENELKLLVYTSGTTGMAKGVMLSSHNLVSCVYYGLQVSTVYDICLSVLPYNHTYEAVCDILVSLHKHSTICINESLRTVTKNLKLYKPTYVFLVPAFAEMFYSKIWAGIREQGKEKIFKKLMKLSNFLLNIGIDMRKVFFKSVHDIFGGRVIKLVCGGAPIRSEVGEFFETIGIYLISGYGITECSPLVSVNRDRFNDFSTAGIKLPCIDIKIDGINEDGCGEICVKGDTVMLGYYKDPEQTEKVMHDGWFYTGDYGKINDKGQLIITGRKKNLIVLSNGKNIYPEEIENYIIALPYIKEVVVYGDKDKDGTEKSIYAEVFLEPEQSEGIDAKKAKADIDALLRDLPYYKQISRVVIRDTEFAKTTSNKIKRDYSK